MGVGSVQAVNIRKNNYQISINYTCHQRGHIIIVANFKFVQSNNVIFVNDGNNTLLDKLHKGVTRIGVAVSIQRLRFSQQHLRHNLTVVCKNLLVGVHQNTLPYGSRSLLSGNSIRLFRQAQSIHANSHRTGGNKNHLLALILQIAQFTGNSINLAEITLAVSISNSTTTHLHDNALSLF